MDPAAAGRHSSLQGLARWEAGKANQQACFQEPASVHPGQGSFPLSEPSLGDTPLPARPSTSGGKEEEKARTTEPPPAPTRLRVARG